MTVRTRHSEARQTADQALKMGAYFIKLTVSPASTKISAAVM